MHVPILARTLLLITLLVGMGLLRAGGEPADLPLGAAWSGDYPVTALDRLPEGQRKAAVGLLADKAAFARVWEAFRPAEPLPEVDFDTDLVAFARNVTYYNVTRIFKVTQAAGIVQVMAMETRSAARIEAHVAMALVSLPRADVRGIDTGSGTYWLHER